MLIGRCWRPARHRLLALDAGAPGLREVETDVLAAQLEAGAEIAQIIPELRERFPTLPAPSTAEPEGARFCPSRRPRTFFTTPPSNGRL